MRFQKVMCGKKITCDNLYVRSLTTAFQPQTPSQRNWIAERGHAAAWMLVRDRFGHQHDLSGYIGPSMPQRADQPQARRRTLAPARASMPCQRLRSIPERVQPLSGLVLRARTGANVFCVAIFNIRVDRPETRFELSRDRFAPARYGAVTALVLRREGGDARALLPAQSTGWP